MLNGEGAKPTKILLKLSPSKRILLYRLVGIISYLNISQHTYNIGMKISPGDIGVISFRYVTIADHDGLITLIKFIQGMEKKGVTIILTAIKRSLKSKIDSIKQENLAEEFAKRSWKSLVEY